MRRFSERTYLLDVWLLGAFIFIPIAITPFMNLDAINLIKMLLLSIFGLGAIAFVFGESLADISKKIVLWLVLGFNLSLCLSALFNGSGLWPQFWGSQGRNSGIVTLFSFSILFLVTCLKTKYSSAQKFLYAIPLVGLVNIVYGLAQYLNKDPIDWQNPYSPIVGTLGNPNFISSHLGLVSAGCVLLIFQLWAQKSPRKILLSLLLLLETILGLFVIWKSLSIQGLLVFSIVIATSLYFCLIVFVRSKLLSVMLGFAGLSIASVIATGFYGRGPLSATLYRESFVHRSNFWEAGINMLIDRPLTGVGIDQFGDFYRAYRSLYAVQLRGPAVTTDSAHNIPIDIASGGGILPLTFYILVQLLTLGCGIWMIRKMQKIDLVKVATLSLWLGYQAQTLISINQIGVSIWGWILGGLVVSLCLNTVFSNSASQKQTRKIDNSNFGVKLTFFVALGLIFSLTPMLQDQNFRKALATSNGVKIISASMSRPVNPFYLNYAAALLNSNGYEDQAIELSKKAVAINPKNYVGWKLIMDMSEKESADYIRAVKALRELDPLNNQLPGL
jgi:O-antigen ligase